MRHWTKVEREKFERQWLRERMPHTWSTAAPTRCTRCGVKFSATSSARPCKKRRRPNRAGMHLRRALQRAMYERTDPKPAGLGTAVYWIEQLREIARDARRVPELQPTHPRYLVYWQCHRLARRHRRALRELWKLPKSVPISADTPPDPWTGQLTRQRNRLLQEVQQTQVRTIQRGACTYTFRADAVFNGRLLFTP